jgi:hypothetical protein
MAVCWEQEQPDGKAVTSSTSEVVSEITLNPECMVRRRFASEK